MYYKNVWEIKRMGEENFNCWKLRKKSEILPNARIGSDTDDFLGMWSMT